MEHLSRVTDLACYQLGTNEVKNELSTNWRGRELAPNRSGQYEYNPDHSIMSFLIVYCDMLRSTIILLLLQLMCISAKNDP